MLKKYYVYAIIQPETGEPFYIGKGTGRRYKQHLTDKPDYCHNKRLNQRISKIREMTGTNPEVKILHENLEETLAYDIEAKLIMEYGRKNYDKNGILLNHLIDCRPPSFSGPANPFYGKKHTLETRKKMSDAKKGKPILHLIGRVVSEETKAKLSLIAKNRTKDHLKKAAATRSREWEVTFPDGHIEVIKNLSQFCRDNNISQGLMVSNGKTKGYSINRKFYHKPKTKESKEKIALSNSSKWLITYPDGNQKEIVNLRLWGKENGVSHGNLITHGHSKGYKAVKIED